MFACVTYEIKKRGSAPLFAFGLSAKLMPKALELRNLSKQQQVKNTERENRHLK
jgi:hypothetical protein